MKLFAMFVAMAFGFALAGCAASEEEAGQNPASDEANVDVDIIEEGEVAITPTAQGWTVDTDLTPNYEIAAVNNDGILLSAFPPNEDAVVKSRIVSCTIDGKEYPVGSADSPITYTLVKGQDRTDFTSDPTYEVADTANGVYGVQFYIKDDGMSEDDYRDVTLTVDEEITRGDSTENRTGTVRLYR